MVTFDFVCEYESDGERELMMKYCEGDIYFFFRYSYFISQKILKYKYIAIRG